ncbi:porin [Variovorax sp. J22P271]|uniref:porin n=1 Tax=Variovorax davisae TaxID=3053515 RepID=UPI002575343F|nr:porin [Variovorax sp. J22P271]MDM0033769.1 porin [Variovorax sp. J22P271]
MNTSRLHPALVGLAALLTAHAASAQSSMTLFGIVDASVSHYEAGPRSQTVLANSALNNTRLGFRGTEDLGGGMSANFWLEGALNVDDGNASGFNFARRSTVSLAGVWGELRLGRDFTPTFWNDAVFDFFNATGVGTSVISQARSSSTSPGRMPFTADFGANNPTYIRASNSVGYFLPPTLNGFYGQLQYAFDEQVSPGSNQGRYVAGRVGYLKGPVNLAVAVGRTTGADPATAAAPDVSTVNVGASYDFGPAKLAGQYSREKYEKATASNTSTGYMLGVSVPLGVGSLNAAYSWVDIDLPGTPSADKIALGYVHNLSKRTALYATVAHLGNKNRSQLTVANSLQGTANASSTGYDFGIRHIF